MRYYLTIDTTRGRIKSSYIDNIDELKELLESVYESPVFWLTNTKNERVFVNTDNIVSITMSRKIGLIERLKLLTKGQINE